jgi:hypothetical protein
MTCHAVITIVATSAPVMGKYSCLEQQAPSSYIDYLGIADLILDTNHMSHAKKGLGMPSTLP